MDANNLTEGALKQKAKQQRCSGSSKKEECVEVARVK